ncbi:MAG: hypothetical protein JNK05_05560 [Myxococcales bacterium]|nr:hypothetical protein [Myxococcales bacterium]
MSDEGDKRARIKDKARIRGALFDALAGLSLLEPDAEADACGAAFESFVRDRMDEWHDALDRWSPGDPPTRDRTLFITRSARALVEFSEAHPSAASTVALSGKLSRKCQSLQSMPEVRAVLPRLRAALEPVFRRSKHWQKAVALLPYGWRVPWLMQAYAQCIWLSAMRVDVLPAPFGPWLELWCRGAWPMPVGDGGVAVWVPQRGEGVEGIERELRACPFERVGMAPPTFFFAPPCFDDGPGTGGVSLGGYEQVLFDEAPPLVLVPPKPRMRTATFNPPPPPLWPNPGGEASDGDGILARLRRRLRGE